MLPSLVPTALVFLMVSHHGILGCFPMDDVFQVSTVWSQDLRNPWRRLHTICQESDDKMKVENQSPETITYDLVNCLQRFSGHRYLVKVVQEGKWREGYQCLRFTPLTRQVVRRATTKLQKERAKVNCQTDVYNEDEELMIAYNHMTTQASPLTGGYQLIWHKGSNIRDHCLDKIQAYNPRLEFDCGGKHVVADFGKDCAPIIPVQDQSQYRLPFAHLDCVGSWDEPGVNVKAILLRDRLTFWCLHYKPVEGSAGELLSIHLSFRGRCSGHVFNHSKTDLPDEFGTYGILSKYVPSNDNRCVSRNVENCVSHESKCLESNSCPLSCLRCNQKIEIKDCGVTGIVGNWLGGDSAQGLSIVVERQGFRLTGHGLFSCVADNSYGPALGDVHLVVRNDPYSSCMPFYACAKLSMPVPGILNFFLEATDRDNQTGNPMKCKHKAYGPGIIIPSEHTTLTTLLKKDSLQTVPCRVHTDMLFPTNLQSCKFALKQCSGHCSILHGDYDPDSCGNDTESNIDHDHVCHASFRFEKGVQGIITKSLSYKRYNCWLFDTNRLYITPPEFCNEDGAKYIFIDYRSLTSYDPFMAISLLNGNSGSDAKRAPNTNVLNFSVCLIVLLSFL